MEKFMTKEEWKKRRRIKRYVKLGIFCFLTLLLFILLIMGLKAIYNAVFSTKDKLSDKAQALLTQITIEDKHINKNPNTRIGKELNKVGGIVIHYIGISGQSAEDRWKYFNENVDGKQGSCHYIIGFNGEVINCIPDNEIALASAKRNSDSISIEYSHYDYDGVPSDMTYDALVKLTAYLIEKHNLETDAIIRHSDITGYTCPPYFTEDAEAWTQFLNDVKNAVDNAGTD